ncbi:apoptosis regulatory protein Siva isoform X2 [Alligator mississippiensis]|uniref:apoptosis regulatory protein Siva isoform X2 n=1 Tax=Alligator mississippiensis TaxID=8496 RepID=UPI0028780F0C|nr:apoptosis regulatory protein Siva isoform X2 [Alligator mississippiensis]
MPKRRCPFAEAAAPQRKTRVGLREMSRGVAGDTYRRQVYERTRQLLFRGAQACPERAARPDPPPPPHPALLDPTGEPESAGQMLLGPDGRLLRRPARDRAPPMGVSKACSSCIRTVDIKEVCTQCDHLICQHCSKLCSCCNTVICSMCCTIDYSDVGDQVLCSGCSMFEV